MCDNDTSAPFDCATLTLGQCSAGTYYACPATVNMPAGRGFRKKIAANIATCLADPSFPGADITKCVKVLESCVRRAVSSSCYDPDALATCRSELADCPDQQILCAKFLSSLEPKTRVSALDDMRQQRGKSSSCNFNWDINGFPFCPFCPFSSR